MTNKQNASSLDEDNLAMRALAEGDDGALSKIIKRWQGPIISFIYRTTGEYETSVDLAQEVFVRLYRNRKAYKVGSKFSNYLFMIAANLSKNHFRWKSRHPESRLEEDWGSNISGDGVTHQSPRLHLERSEEGARLQGSAVIHS